MVEPDRGMDEPFEVPYSMIQEMTDLEAAQHGDGIDGKGRRFSIQRYVSTTTGKVYDCVFTAGDTPKCMEIPSARRPPKPE